MRNIFIAGKFMRKLLEYQNSFLCGFTGKHNGSFKYELLSTIFYFFLCLTGCSLLNKYDLSEEDLITCTNSKDDDGDGLIDCEDPECRMFVEKKRMDMGEIAFADFIRKNDELIKCLQMERSESYCVDNIDNDGDNAIDCADLDCWQKDVMKCKIEDTGEPSTPIEDTFVNNPPDLTDGNDFWGYYLFQSKDSKSLIKKNEGNENGWIIKAEAGENNDISFREEVGIYSKKIINLWGNLTDIELKLKLSRVPDDVPVIVAFALDSVIQDPVIMPFPSPQNSPPRPFLNYTISGSEISPAKKAVAMLYIYREGAVKLCWRYLADNQVECNLPEPVNLKEPVSEDGILYYEIVVSDSIFNIYQKIEGNDNDESYLLISQIQPSPYHPDIARLFFVASTNIAGGEGVSEMIVKEVKVKQTTIEPPLEYQERILNETNWVSTYQEQQCRPELLGDRVDRIEIDWAGDIDGTCSVFLGTELTERKLTMNYRFGVISLVPNPDLNNNFAYFLPGLWDPLMNFSLGMAFAAGLSRDSSDNYYFVFRPCSSNVPVQNNYMYAGEKLDTMSYRVFSGYDAENHFSYVLFQRMDVNQKETDFVSFVNYETVCRDLVYFGFTSHFASYFSAGSNSSGIVRDIEIKSFPRLGFIEE